MYLHNPKKINHKTQRIHVWNIYLHWNWDCLKLHLGANVGKYSIYMDPLG